MDSYSLKSVLDLPEQFHSVFKFRYFNSLQSECFPICFHSDTNMVISAPTGSGKTVLFELCILRLLSKFLSQDGKFIHIKGALKTVYIAPSKALVQEKLREWSQKFGSWGMICLELTGDNEYYNSRNIQEADVILTTPEENSIWKIDIPFVKREDTRNFIETLFHAATNESIFLLIFSADILSTAKFDAVTRYHIKDGGLSFFSDIALLLIDEVHLLNDPRGSALEAIVSRIKMIAEKAEMRPSPLATVRFLAVSATIPNVYDIAEWLRVPPHGVKMFGEEMRPVKLTTKVFGYAPAKNDFLFEKRLQNYIFDILMQFSRGKSALVFCSTRKGAQEAAQKLSQVALTFGYSNPFIKNQDQQDRLREASLTCSDKQMQSYILYGVGYHNGGLCSKDRSLVEDLFLKGDIQVLCTTNTLAHGINLPAHTVIIKSTQYFNKEKGQYMEYDRSTVLQMCGRAGRPPFEDTGMVVIMTRRETVHLYENFLNGCEVVESQLLSCLTEHLTAEIAQLTVSDITKAIEWMNCSYLSVRIKKNPEKYGVRKSISRDHIEKHLQEICVKKVNELSHYRLVWTDEDGFLLRPLEPGRLMTRYYLKFDTMKHIMQTPINYSLEDLLNIVCQAEEISWIQLRRNEKKLLNDLNVDKDNRLRFHINDNKGKRKKRIQTREEKVFVLANDCLTGDPSAHDLSLTQDTNSICSNGCRVARCMKEYFIYMKNYKGALNSTLLAKSLDQRLWDISPYLLKQLPGIGMVTAKALHSMGVTSFDALAEADPRKIEIVTGRKYPFGNHIKESLRSLPPKVEMKVEKIEVQGKLKPKLLITLSRLSQPVQSTKRHYADMIVGSEEDNLILFQEKIRVNDFSSPYSVTILLPEIEQGMCTVKADFVFEEYIGIDLHQKLQVMKDNISKINRNHGNKQPSSFAPAKRAFAVEDDSKTTSNGHAEETEYMMKSTKEDGEESSMPSFSLLGEDAREDVSVVQNDDDECKIITEKTVFDHIRDKAKEFPVLATSNNAFFPSSEVLNLARKRSLEKQSKLHGEVGETEGKRSKRQFKYTIDSPTLQTKKGAQNRMGNMKHPTSTSHCSQGSLHNTYLMGDTGGLAVGPADSMFKTLTQDTIFDHIQKKSREFPVLKRPNLESEPIVLDGGNFSGNQPEFQSTSFDILCDNNSENHLSSMATTCSETKEVIKDTHDTKEASKLKQNMAFERSRGLYELVSLSPKVASSSANPSTTNMPTFDISMAKGSKIQSGHTSTSSPGSKKKQQCSPQTYSSEALMNYCCSSSTDGPSKEADSFLGFKSVFSFLW